MQLGNSKSLEAHTLYYIIILFFFLLFQPSQQGKVVINSLTFPRTEVIDVGNDLYLVEVPGCGYGQLSACLKTGYPPVRVEVKFCVNLTTFFLYVPFVPL